MRSVDLEGRVAVVTGSGGGLGRVHALAMAARGAKVLVTDLGAEIDGSGRSEDPAAAVADEIRNQGGDAVAVCGDVASPDDANTVITTAIETWGSIDVVVNNAGFIRDRSIAKLTEDDWDAVVDVHLKGAFLMTRAALAHMKERNYGRFVHTTSPAGLFGNFGQANYGAAKMGIVGFSRALAIEGAKYGIKSNVISPVAATPRVKDIGLLGSLADVLLPEQVSSLIVALASAECDVTGEVFSVIGGRYARVFTAVTPGWFAGKGSIPEPGDLLAHLQEIRKEEGYSVPTQAMDEMATVLPLLNGGS